MRLGARALKSVPAEQRQFSSITLNVRWDRFAEIRDRLRRIEDEFCGVAEAVAGDEIYQLNLQFFPLTKPAPGEAPS